MNGKSWIFFFFFAPEHRDREWPIAINVDQPKLLPKQQGDRVQSRRGNETVSVPCVCSCCFAKKRSHGWEGENQQPFI